MKPKQIWANLAVKDVELTRRFYTALGFTSNEGDSKSKDITSFKIGEHGFVVNIFSLCGPHPLSEVCNFGLIMFVDRVYSATTNMTKKVPTQQEHSPRQ